VAARLSGASLALLAMGPGALAVGWLVIDPHRSRLALAAAAACLLGGVGLVGARTTLYALVIWLAALGLVRRLTYDLSPVGEADFLLLVGPFAIGVLLIAARPQGAFARRTRLSNTVLVLSALIVAGALNPLQGSPLVGLAGLLFVLVPVLTFWIGRGLCDDRTLSTVLKLIAALSVLVSLYGLAQTFVGFPPWDSAWIREFGYEALTVKGETRAFASFSAASEYAMFLVVAIVIWLGFGLRLGWIPLTAAAVALLAAAIFFESARGPVFMLVAATTLMAAAWRRVPVAVAAVLSLAVVLVVPFIASRLLPAGDGGTAAPGLVSHQLEGLANPLDPEASTLLGHLSLVESGFRSALSNPLGIGVGPVTNAGGKFGGLQAGTETDPSNVAVALGIPGLLAYTALFFIAFWQTYHLAARRRDSLALVALGILAVTAFQWLNGGQYAVALLPWLVLGWVDNSLAKR
jgi:hypothetical protein